MDNAQTFGTIAITLEFLTWLRAEGGSRDLVADVIRDHGLVELAAVSGEKRSKLIFTAKSTAKLEEDQRGEIFDRQADSAALCKVLDGPIPEAFFDKSRGFEVVPGPWQRSPEGV